MDNKKIYEILQELASCLAIVDKKINEIKFAAYGIMFILLLIIWFK